MALCQSEVEVEILYGFSEYRQRPYEEVIVGKESEFFPKTGCSEHQSLFHIGKIGLLNISFI